MKMVSDVQKHLSTVANSTLANKLLWRDILHHIKLSPGQLIRYWKCILYLYLSMDKPIFMILLSIINKLERYGQLFQSTNLLCFDAHLDLLSVDMKCASTLFSMMRTTLTWLEWSSSVHASLKSIFTVASVQKTFAATDVFLMWDKRIKMEEVIDGLQMSI